MEEKKKAEKKGEKHESGEARGSDVNFVKNEVQERPSEKRPDLFADEALEEKGKKGIELKNQVEDQGSVLAILKSEEQKKNEDGAVPEETMDLRIRPATISKKGSCLNCGANGHVAKTCFERPRGKGKWTGVARDDVIKASPEKLSYSAKRDSWASFDFSSSSYGLVCQRFEAREEARKKFLNEQPKSEKVEKPRQNINKITSRSWRDREDVAHYLLKDDSLGYDSSDLFADEALEEKGKKGIELKNQVEDQGSVLAILKSEEQKKTEDGAVPEGTGQAPEDVEKLCNWEATKEGTIHMQGAPTQVVTESKSQKDKEKKKK